MHGLHQGYLYQDLLAAFLIAENLHKKDFEIAIELKENKLDYFDDIAIIVDGKKTKCQVKHSSTNQILTEADFTNKSSNLNLDKLSKSFFTSEVVRYVIATNRRVQATSFFTIQKKRKNFSLINNTYSINLRNTKRQLFMKHLLIEASLPNASFNLSKPGNLEKELLESLRLKVGIGSYPNNLVSARDVAGRLILLASQLRGSKKSNYIDRKYIFKYISLNMEYGHIAQEFPFISSEYRVYRNKIVAQLNNLIRKHKFTVLEGPPGSGKSHIFDDLFNKISTTKTLVARHFCYLEPTDRFAQERIAVDAMYGNFLYQIKELEPAITEQVTPHFAATKTTLEKLIEKIAESGKEVVLMVDGLDHLNRVVAQNKLPTDMVQIFIGDLLSLRLPTGCYIFIASQPSAELKNIIQHKNATVYSLQPWDEKLVKEFIAKHNSQLASEREQDTNPDTIKLLTEKTEGNPLYLTYIIEEILSINSKVDFSNYIRKLPKLNKDLKNYYKYLTKDITDSDTIVVQTLALLDFSVSPNELSEMFPPIQKRVIDMTINKIRPILKPGMAQGGIRIYHESFRQFIIESGYQRGQQDRELYKHITDWLEKAGFFQSQRTYRYLIPYLIRSNRENKIYEVLGKDYVALSLFYFHSVESIVANLNKIADYAARKQRWEIYCKAVELRRALHTFSEERLDSVYEVYHQAIMNVQGVDMFCERMLFDGKPVFTKTDGILMCQMAEHKGGNPPWDFYDVAGMSMEIDNSTRIHEYQKVESAHFLNRIRRSSLNEAVKTLKEMIRKNNFTGTEQRQIDMLIDEFEYVFGVSRHSEMLTRLNLSKQKKHSLSLAVARYLYRDGHKRKATKLCTGIIRQTNDLSHVLDAVLLGVDTKGLVISQNITKLTQKVLAVEHHGDKETILFKQWYQILRILSHNKPSVIKRTMELVGHIDGWYRAWILYLFELSLLEASKLTRAKKEKLLEEMLTRLNRFSHPFLGKPRACDLFPIWDLSTDSFRRTLKIAKAFSNYAIILNLLSSISKRTTSYLQGSSGGPLSGENFNSLLKEAYSSLDDAKRKIVVKILEQNIQDGIGASVYYDSYAFEYLKLATVLAMNKNLQRSKECLMDGCLYLAAYGHRKDVTIYEIIEPIKYIARKNLQFAANAFKKSYPLVETVWRYTDRSETVWSLVYWLRALVDSDPKIALQALSEMLQKDHRRDWRIEEGTEYLCEKLLENKINPEAIADLYETIDQTDNTQINVSPGLKIVYTLLKDNRKERAQKLFNFISKTLYRVSVLKYVDRKENFVNMIEFKNRHKLKIEYAYGNKFKEESGKKGISNYQPVKKKEKIPGFSFSKLSIDEIQRLVDMNLHSHFLRPKNARNLALSLKQMEVKHSEKVYDLILSIVRRGLDNEKDVNGLLTLRDIFRTKGRNKTAAFISMLGFVYARGADGWYFFNEGKYNYLGSDSFRLSNKVAKETLANEMSYLFSKGRYFLGPVRFFIEFFSKNAKVKIAERIWEEAHNVIKFRLPTHRDLDIVLANETPTFKYKRKKSINTLLADLISIRKTITN